MRTFDTPEPITATIELFVGTVRIVAGDRADTVVDVRPTDENDESDVRAAGQTRVEYTAGALLVKAPRARGLASWSGKSRSVDVTVELPTGSRVHGHTSVGDLDVRGRLGECTFRSATGRVRIDRAGPLRLRTVGHVTVGQVDGRAEVTTGSGRLRVDRIDGTAELKNSNGDTEVGDVTGEVRVRASNGDIAIDRPGAGVDAKTANGTVRVHHVVRGSVVAESGCGDLEIGIAEGTAARLDVRTGFGRVHNALRASAGPEPTDETATVHAHTGYGDIVVTRS